MSLYLALRVLLRPRKSRLKRLDPLVVQDVLNQREPADEPRAGGRVGSSRAATATIAASQRGHPHAAPPRPLAPIRVPGIRSRELAEEER